jgi:esterase/lipase
MKRRRLWWLLVPGILVVAAVVFLAGPRPDRSPDLPNVDAGNNVGTYVTAADSQFPDIVPGTEKLIEWAGAPGERTDVAVVFLHGFSGSRQEMVPAPQLVARELGANLFSTRYTGHGRGPDPMGEATVQSWVNDTAEAIAVGRALGDFVVVIAVSTAAPLVAWLDVHRISPDAAIFASPNFGPADDTAELLLLPWGRTIARAVVGETTCFETISEQHERYTTPCFPSTTLVTMMGAVQLGRRAELESMRMPLLMLYSVNDGVVSLDRMSEAYERMGSPQKEMREIRAATGHVLAGDTHSPASTDEFVRVVTGFVRELR